MKVLSDIAKSFFATSIILVALSMATSASAAWVSQASKVSGSLAMASFGHTFTPVNGGGAGGTSYTSPMVYILGSDTYYLTITNSSSVPASITGTVGANYGGFNAPSVSVRSCGSTWNGNSCPSSTLLYSGNPNSPAAINYGVVPANGIVRIQLTSGHLLDNTNVILTAKASPSTSGTDRTAG